MEVYDIAQQIEKKAKLLDKALIELKKRGEQKSDKSAMYDKQIAITIMKLRNGESLTFEGQEIKDPPVSVTEKIAKGLCYGFKLDMDSADTSYKTILEQIDIIKTQIMAYQSIYRHLQQT